MNEKCKNCKRSETGCLKYIASLPPEDLSEWCLRRKNALSLTNQNIADLANISKRTVDRFFAADVRDFRFSSVQPIIFALLQDFDCTPQTTFDIERADLKIQHLEERLKTERRDLLYARKYLFGVSVALAIAIAVIIIALIFDMMHLDRGFFWLE